MSLGRSKQYAAKLNATDLVDKSAERINRATPHQAPQRVRVSSSTRTRHPSSAAAAASSRKSPSKQRGWKDHITPSVNMGVPTLMMILEPNVVWRHPHEPSTSTSRRVAEVATCQGAFFDGPDQLCKLSHGVYEGNYWQLLGDLAELEDMLGRMTRAPVLLQEPTLELPQQPELPKWEQFKPKILPLPEAPAAATALVLPEFLEPDLPQSVDLPAPELLQVPPLPAPRKEVVAPNYVPPVAPKSVPLQLPELVLPPAPVIKEPVKPATPGPPQHGHDWSGKRPFTVPVPSYLPPSLPPEPMEAPEQLPAPELQEAQLELMPVPIAKLGWQGGPEDPQDIHMIPVLGSSVGTADSCNAAMAGSASGAIEAAIQPGCTKQALAMGQLHDAWKEVQMTSPASTGDPAVWLDFKPPFAEAPPVLLPHKPDPGPEPELQPAADLQDLPVLQLPVPQPMPEYVEPPLVLPSWAAPCEPLPVGFLRGTAPVLIMDVSGTMHPARRGQFLRVNNCVCELLEPHGELFTAGTAFDVLAFSGSCWSWSAAYAGKQALLASAMQGSYSSTARQAGGQQAGQIVQHTSLVSRSRTQWQRQQLQQRWQEQQQQKLPIHASQDSRPGTAAGSATARSATAEVAAVNSVRPASAGPMCRSTQAGQVSSPRPLQTIKQTFGPVLQPTDAEHLLEAKGWVHNWPEAVGNTNLLTALMTAHQYTYSADGSTCRSPKTGVRAVAAMGATGEMSRNSVDCYYLFSDGLADDASACLEWVQQQAEAGTPLRPVHTVGFFPRNGSTAGERFLSQLAAATAGTFQVYNADLPAPAAAAAIVRKAKDGCKQGSTHDATAAVPTEAASAAGVPKVWDSALGVFMVVDLQNEDAATRVERQWAEEKLKQRRLDNKRLGRFESLNVMLEAVRQQHQQERVLLAMEQHQQKLLQSKAAHTAGCAAVTRANEVAVRQAQRVHAVAVQQVQEENKRRIAAAQQAHASAVYHWRQQYEEALQAWEQAVAEAQSVAAATAAAVEAQAQGITPQLPASGVTSGVDIQQGCQSDSRQHHTTTSTGSYRGQHTESVAVEGISSSRVSFSRDSSCLGSDMSFAADAAAVGVTGTACGSSSTQLQLLPANASSASSGDLCGADQQGEAAGTSSSAKLTYPLPALPETHSHRSLCSWGGTPRLPDAVLVASAGQPASTASSPTSAANDRWSRPVSAPGTGKNMSSNGNRAGSACSKSTYPAASDPGVAGTTAGLGKLKANSRPKSASTAASRGNLSSAGSNATRQKLKHSNSSSNASRAVEQGTSDPQQTEQLQWTMDPVKKVSRSRPGSAAAAAHRRTASAAGKQDLQPLRLAATAADVAHEGIVKEISVGSVVEAVSDPSSISGQQYETDHGQQQQQQQALGQEEKLLLHIQFINAANREALEHLYEDWHSQVVEVEQHNTSTLQMHKKQSMLHAAHHAAYLKRHAAWEREVQQLERRARHQYESAAAHAAAENARLAKLHAQEVANKLAKDAAYSQVAAEHTAAQSVILKQHQVDVAAAKAAHAAAVAAAKEHWQQQQVEMEREHQLQLEAALQQHTELVQQIKEQNRLAREAHKVASEAYRAATLENKRRLALYQEQQEVAAAQLTAANEVALQHAREDYKVLCAQLEELHHQQQVAAQDEWLAARAAVQQSNEQALAAAQARYAAAVDEMLQEHQATCEELQQKHAAELARIKSRNDELMPQVLAARLATIELARVKLFAAHMRTCAAKMQLGVNFLADTPNLDRVVEMSALTNALKAAFPDTAEPSDYPWPVHDCNIQQSQQQLGSMPAESRASAAAVAVGAVNWGRCRPCTAPPAAARPASAASRNGSSTVSLGSLRHAKGGWRAKSPSTVSLRASMQDPAVIVKQLQRSSTYTGCGGGISVVSAPDQSQQQWQASGSPRSWLLASQGQLAAGHTASAGHTIPPCLQPPPNTDSIHRCSLLQRPQTAPVFAGRGALGNTFHRSYQQHCEEYSVEGGGMMLLVARQVDLAAAGRSTAMRSKADRPARHAVGTSAAAQRMAQVLVLHQRRLSGREKPS